jgi:methylase of polypeptide subunit release factors
MNEFIKYLKRENLIQKLLEYYKSNQLKQIAEEYFNKFIERLEGSEDKLGLKYEKNVLNSNFNSLGKFYEETLPQKDRKILGEFYTPESIVSYILNAVGYKQSSNIQTKKLIDISCGSGSFIILAIRVLINCCFKRLNRHDFSEILPEEAKNIVMRILDNISGIDINPLACILCQINIHFELFELLKIIKSEDKDFHLPIFNIIHSNSLVINETEQYDYVVGNPPYLFIRDIPNPQKQIIEKGNFDTNDGQYDYYQIFIELGIRLLRSKGILGYIVPDSLLALSNRSILRKYIYNNTKIREIYNIGPQFEDPIVSNIILVLQKESDVQERERNFIKVRFSDQEPREIYQNYLEEWDYKFLIHLIDEDIYLINYLNNKFPKLKDLIKKEDFNIILSRGIELTKKGEIIYCNNCKKYFPLPKKELVCKDCGEPFEAKYVENIIFDIIPNDDDNVYSLFLYSIKRYQAKDYKYIDIGKKGINYKNFDLYKDRVIIRQLSQNNLICATYDKKLSLTSQSLYNLKIYESPVEEFNNLYILGILNSMLLSYYFIKSFGSYKKLFPRILIEKIKDLPIKVPENNREKGFALNVIEKVESLLNMNENDLDKFKKEQEEIDDIVFNLYNIQESDKQYILEFMNTL